MKSGASVGATRLKSRPPRFIDVNSNGLNPIMKIRDFHTPASGLSKSSNRARGGESCQDLHTHTISLVSRTISHATGKFRDLDKNHAVSLVLFSLARACAIRFSAAQSAYGNDSKHSLFDAWDCLGARVMCSQGDGRGRGAGCEKGGKGARTGGGRTGDSRSRGRRTAHAGHAGDAR